MCRILSQTNLWLTLSVNCKRLLRTSMSRNNRVLLRWHNFAIDGELELESDKDDDIEGWIDEKDDDVEGWIDEMAILSPADRTKLEADIRPVKLVLVKVGNKLAD
jgi:hypothetical protein